jgi:hypothetical protein
MGMGTFLALEAGGSDKPADGAAPRGISFSHTRVGFGFDTRIIGIILFTEAIFRAAIQPTVIPWFMSKLGALRTGFSMGSWFVSGHVHPDTLPPPDSSTLSVRPLVSCLARSVGPLLSGKLFAAGLQHGYLQISFWILGAVALVGAIESAFLLDYLASLGTLRESHLHGNLAAKESKAEIHLGSIFPRSWKHGWFELANPASS